MENKLIVPKHLHNLHSELSHNKLTFTYRKLAIHLGQCKSSVRQKLAAEVVKIELK